MATTQSVIGQWFDEGKKNGAEFMIVVCDTYDYGEYPVYAKRGNFQGVYDGEKNAKMTKIMEVYNLNMDKQAQMLQHRCFNYPDNYVPHN